MNASQVARILKNLRRQHTLNVEYLTSTLEAPINPLHDLSMTDIGRWILKERERTLNERLGELKYPIHLSRADEIALLLSLKFVIETKRADERGLLSFFIKPEIYAFPLLLSFHLLLQHGLENSLEDKLSPRLRFGPYFRPETGLLLVSDNAELSTRLIRTNYGDHGLSETFKTFRVRQDGSFEKLAKLQPESPFPWFGYFRAYRNQLPDKLQLKPEVLVVDTIPVKHRNRVKELIDWAGRLGVKKVITVSSLGDLDTYEVLKSYKGFIFPKDKLAVKLYSYGSSNEFQRKSHTLTSCWSHVIGQNDIDKSEDISITSVEGANLLEGKIEEAFSLIEGVEKQFKSHGLPLPFMRLKAVLLDLVTMIVPPYWFDRERQDAGRTGLKEIIGICRRAVPITTQEKTAYEFVLPVLANSIEGIYNVLLNVNNPPKGQALINIIRDQISRNPNVSILVGVPEKTTAILLIPWLSYNLGLDVNALRNIKVHTFKEIFQEKTTCIQLNNVTQKQLFISCGWIPRKYLGLLHCNIAENYQLVVYPFERSIVEGQINSLFSKRACRIYQEARLETYSKLFGEARSFPDEYEKFISFPRIINEEHGTRLAALKSQKREIVSKDIFGTGALARLLEESLAQGKLDTWTEDTEEEFESLDLADQVAYIKALGDKVSKKIRAYRLVLSDEKEIFVDSMEKYKIYSKQKEKLEDIPATAIYKGDFIVQFKGGERRELFDEILKAAGQTPMMTYTNYRIKQWQSLLRNLYDQCKGGCYNSSEVYEAMLTKIRLHGGTITHVNTLKNWIFGKSNCVQNEVNIKAVALALKDIKNIEEYRRIYQAMRRLWDMHIQIGLKLGYSLRRQISKVVGGNESSYEFIDVFDGVKIPIQEVLDAIRVFEVSAVEKGRNYWVPSFVVGRVLSIKERQKVFGNF